ncbi:MAG: carbohydrate ABC transporter permease [Spirochaetia bacterium]
MSTTALVHTIARRRRRFSGLSILKVLGTLVLLVATVFPLYWMINISLIPEKEVFSETIHYIPPWSIISLETYRQVLANYPVLRYILNSFIICLLATVITLAFSFSMAYYLAKFQFRFKRFFFYFIIWSLSLPWVVYVLPIFRIVDMLKLLDTHILMILLYGFSGIPLFAWFALPYVQEFPDEMIDAARIDGASELSILWRIVRPGLRNVVIALFLIRFIFAYNDLLYSLIFTVNRAKMIIPSILDMPTQYSVPFARMSAGSAISVAPIIILVLVFQRYIVSGLTGRTLK